MFFRKGILVLVSVVLYCFTYLPEQAYSAQVTLAWNPSPESSVAGYKLYCGYSSRTYSTVADVDDQTTYTFQQLQEGTTYFFAVTAYDSNGNESDYSGEVSYPVPHANHSPVADNGTITAVEDTAVTGTLSATDADGDTLIYSIVQQPAKGSVTIADSSTGAYGYTPNTNANGADTFTFKAHDGTIDSSPATVTVFITPVNDAPTAVDDAAETVEGTAVTIDVCANDSDVDGDTLSVVSVTQGTNGSVVVNGANITYTPNQGYSGDDAFTYTMGDGHGGTATARVTITIASVNHPPSASNGSLTVRTETVATGRLNATDKDGDLLSYAIVELPVKGLITITDVLTGSFTYEPNIEATGNDSFTFVASDGEAWSNIAVVEVTIRDESSTPSLTGVYQLLLSDKEQ